MRLAKVKVEPMREAEMVEELAQHPIADVATMDHLLSESIAQPRFCTLLLGGFAALALVLGSIGI